MESTNEPEYTYLQCVLDACDELPHFTFDRHSTEPFGVLDYPEECRIKTLALKLFWKRNHLAGVPSELIPAPEPRHYRTTSKRKVESVRNKVRLLHLGHGAGKEMRGNLQYSLLEPDLHHRIYEAVLEHLSRPQGRLAAREMNYCILRSSGEKVCVIFNLARLNAAIVRRLRTVAEELHSEIPEIASAFLYLDESRSNYYLEAKRPTKSVGWKKLFGSSFLDVTLPGGRRLLYPPTGFSQVNGPMLPVFLNTAEELIRPEADARLLDLYCGYGLIGLHLFPGVSSMLGVEIDGPSVETAAANAEHLFPQQEIRFIRSEISPALIRDKFPPASGKELLVLDPPRSGTANGVIKELARRKPLRVLHIFCGTDTIPSALEQWTSRGYQPLRIVPLDLFPGTPNLETMILFEPGESEGKQSSASIPMKTGKGENKRFRRKSSKSS